MRELMMKMADFHELPVEEKYTIELKRPSRYVRKWRLAVFLSRNPKFVFFRKSFINELHVEEFRALNEVDSNDQINRQRRLSIYQHRMSSAQPNVVLNDILKYFDERRF